MKIALERNSKNKNSGNSQTGIYEFQNGSQPRTNMVKDDKGDLLAELHTTLIGGRITSARFLNQ